MLMCGSLWLGTTLPSGNSWPGTGWQVWGTKLLVLLRLYKTVMILTQLWRLGKPYFLHLWFNCKVVTFLGAKTMSSYSLWLPFSGQTISSSFPGMLLKCWNMHFNRMLATRVMQQNPWMSLLWAARIGPSWPKTKCLLSVWLFSKSLLSSPRH